MKKIFILAVIIGSATFVTGGVGCSNLDKKQELHTTIEQEGQWKGFKKTDMGTYIPESYEQVYERMISSDSFFYQDEKNRGYQAIFSWDEYLKLFKEKNKICQQAYPPNAMVCPFYPEVDDRDYVNGIIFIPDSTLQQSKNEKLGLTEVQYTALEKDLAYYNDQSRPDRIEVMNISCSMDQIPSAVLTLTFRGPAKIDYEYLPIVKNEGQKLQIGYHWWMHCDNSERLYVLTKDGGCVNFDGKYDGNGKFQEHVREVDKSQIERMFYLYFHGNVGPYIDEDASCWVPKIIVFNLVD